MTTTLPTAEQASQRHDAKITPGVMTALYLGIASAEDQTLAADAIAGLREALKGAIVVTSTAGAEIKRLTEERDKWKAARDACENAYQETMIAASHNLDRAEEAEASLAAVKAERDAMRAALLEAVTKVENDRTLWTPEWQVWALDAGAALSLDAEVKP